MKSETNIYYSLKSLSTNNLTNLKYRMLKYRLKELLTAGSIKLGKLLYKESNTWFIHFSFVDLFQARRNHSNSLKTEKYKNEVTINLPCNYDDSFYNYLGMKITLQLAPFVSIYSVEPSPTEKNKYHLHLISTADINSIIESLKNIESLINLTILENKNTNIAPIVNKTQTINYISKCSQLLIDKLKI